MSPQPLTTLERIHQAARQEFLAKGFQRASLRKIVQSVGMTTGAFYGYYRSKADLFAALVGPAYDYILGRFLQAQQAFAALPPQRQVDQLSQVSGRCMEDILHYAYDHLEACQLLLCCAEGTRYADLVDEMVAVEIQATHNYQDVLGSLGMPSPRIDPQLEHILVTGMFRAFFELVIHAMPLPAAERYLQEMRAFYTAGWMKMMGQT